MTSFPPPPAGASFVIDFDDEQRPRLTWATPCNWFARWLPAAFIAFWLCGWAAGEFFACWAIVGMLGNVGNGVEWFGVGFLLLWLTFWTFGGVAAMLTLATLIRGPKPERLTLLDDALRYDPGTAASQDDAPSRRSPWKAGKPTECTRDEISALSLERVGERQRLSIDVGAERIEIGPNLKEPEREWLAQVLHAWWGRNHRPENLQ